MAALPKRKISSAKQGQRRRQIKLNQPTITKCPACGALKRPHYRCGNCGDKPRGGNATLRGK